METQNKPVRPVRRAILAALILLLLIVLFIAAVAADTAWKHHEVEAFLRGEPRSRLTRVVFSGSIYAGRVVLRSPKALAYLQRILTSGGERRPCLGDVYAELVFANGQRLNIILEMTKRHIYVSDNYFIVSQHLGSAFTLPKPVPGAIRRLRRWLRRTKGRPIQGGTKYF